MIFAIEAKTIQTWLLPYRIREDWHHLQLEKLGVFCSYWSTTSQMILFAATYSSFKNNTMQLQHQQTNDWNLQELAAAKLHTEMPPSEATSRLWSLLGYRFFFNLMSKKLILLWLLLWRWNLNSSLFAHDLKKREKETIGNRMRPRTGTPNSWIKSSAFTVAVWFRWPVHDTQGDHAIFSIVDRKNWVTGYYRRLNILLVS